MNATIYTMTITTVGLLTDVQQLLSATVDDFVAARAPGFSKIQQTSTMCPKGFITNHLETTKFNKFQ